MKADKGKDQKLCIAAVNEALLEDLRSYSHTKRTGMIGEEASRTRPHVCIGSDSNINRVMKSLMMSSLGLKFVFSFGQI